MQIEKRDCFAVLAMTRSGPRAYGGQIRQRRTSTNNQNTKFKKLTTPTGRDKLTSRQTAVHIIPADALLKRSSSAEPGNKAHANTAEYESARGGDRWDYYIYIIYESIRVHAIFIVVRQVEDYFNVAAGQA
jgi:hypothetical protein